MPFKACDFAFLIRKWSMSCHTKAIDSNKSLKMFGLNENKTSTYIISLWCIKEWVFIEHEYLAIHQYKSMHCLIWSLHYSPTTMYNKSNHFWFVYGQFDRAGSLTQQIICRMSKRHSYDQPQDIHIFGVVHFKGYEIPK